MGDIDALRKREIPYWAIVDGQGVSIGGTSTLGVLQRRGMESACQVDASGVATDASTLRQLQTRGIQNFCEVTENGIDPVSSATLTQITARGISPRCPVDANGVALTGTSTIDTLRKRGIGYFCPLDENGTATTLSGWVLSGASIDTDFANSRYFGGTLANLFSASRASTGYAQTVAGALVPFANDIPRITDQGLLIEEARTNVLLQSQTLNAGAPWSLNQATLTADQAVAPDGTTTADLVVGTAAASAHGALNGPYTLTAAVYTWSVYVKAAGYNFASLVTTTGAGSGTRYSAVVNLTTGAITQNGTQGSPTATSSTATLLGNGWVRITVSQTATADASTSYFSVIGCATGTPTTTAGLDPNAGQDNVSGIYVWGAQLEIGAFALSLITTVSVSVTRAADNVSGIGALAALVQAPVTFSSVVQTNLIPLAAINGFQRALALSSNGSATALNNNTSAQSYNGAVVLNATLGSGSYSGGIVKSGFSVQNAVARSVVANNGTLTTDANVFGGNTQIFLGSTIGTSNFLNGYIQRLTMWNTRLADATLKALTV